jgi:hypothetical protein
MSIDLSRTTLTRRLETDIEGDAQHVEIEKTKTVRGAYTQDSRFLVVMKLN